MAENQQENTSNDLNQSPNDIPPIPIENTGTTGGENKKTEGEEKKKEPECYKHPEIIINTPKEDNGETHKLAREANRLTVINIFLTVALFFLTLWAIFITKDSVQVSKDSLAEVRRQNTEDSIRQARNESINSIKDSLTINLAAKTLSSYIDNMTDNQRRFQIENRPLLQAINYAIDTSNGIGKTTINYFFINIGKYPAKLVTVRNGAALGVGVPESFMDSVEYTFPFVKNNSYIGGITVATLQVTGFSLTRDKFDYYKAGKCSIYIFGTLHCINLSTKTKFSVKYIYRLNYDNSVEGMRNKEYPGWIK